MVTLFQFPKHIRRNMRFLIREFILFALLFFPFSVLAKSQVASVFVNSELCPGKICLHGEFKQGTKILLLSNQDNKTCAAKVGKKIRIEYTPGPFDASEVSDLKNCK